MTTEKPSYTTAADHYFMGEQMLNQTRRLMNETIVMTAKSVAPGESPVVSVDTERIMLETVQAGAAIARAHFAAASIPPATRIVVRERSRDGD